LWRASGPRKGRKKKRSFPGQAKKKKKRYDKICLHPRNRRKKKKGQVKSG